MKKALLFINGEPPKEIPYWEDYDVVACTDGAFHYLQTMKFPLEQLTFVSGDFDSGWQEKELLKTDNFIFTPDQNKTDFHKALEILLEKNVSKVDVYGGSGGEQDHYLGNLSVAYFFKDKLKITFFDEYSSYFFIPKEFSMVGVKDRMISLIPFPIARNIETQGLKWPLYHEDLKFGERIGTRNVADSDEISVRYEQGDLLIFVEN